MPGQSRHALPDQLRQAWANPDIMEIAFGLADEEMVMTTFAPLFPRKRTWISSVKMSAKGQKRTRFARPELS